MSDMSCALRFDAGDGSNGSDDDGEAKPCEPAHTNDSIHAAGGTCSIELRGFARRQLNLRHMSNSKISTERNRVKAEEGREEAEELRQEADQERGGAEKHRVLAESARKEAETFRALAEEARMLREQYREELESIRQERETLRHASEEARTAAEDARHATIAAVKATADALAINLAQMQFLENARDAVKQLKLPKPPKPGDVH